MPTWISPLHQRIVDRLEEAIRAWIREEPGRGEVVRDAVVPVGDLGGHVADVAWYPPARRSPALVVRVLSPVASSGEADRLVDDCGHHGVSEVWLLDPEEPIAHQHRRLTRGDPTLAFAGARGPAQLLTTPLLPGFATALVTLLDP